MNRSTECLDSKKVKLEWDSDTSVGDPSFVVPSNFQIKQEILNEDSSTSMSASSISEFVPRTPNALMDAYSSPTDSVPPLLNGRYFSIIRKITDTAHQKSANGIIASCELCPNKRTIKGSLKITSNFVQHLKMKHHPFYEKYLCEKKNKVNIKKRGLKFEQSGFDERILKFMIHTYSPLSVVEEPSFINLFRGSSAKSFSVKHIANLLETKFNLSMARLKESLKSVQYVCTTADTWTSNSKLFFVYTCHWIDPDFTRHSAVLACRRYSKTHPTDKITELIQFLNTDFGLNEEKLVSTITYNGSHFGKHFKEFGHFQTAENNSSNEDSEDEIEFVSDLARQPKEQRCGTYTLNLLATTIFNNLLKGHQETHEIHQITFNRCSNIWTKCNKPEMAGVFKDVLGCTLETPKITSWTTLIKSLRNLLKHKDRLDDLCSALCVEKFHAPEFQYMEEYCLLMEVIADGLDFLQKENNSFYGYFLPTLVTIKVKLIKLYKSENLNYLTNLTKEMENALVDSFKDIFEINPSAYDYIIATMSCPSIKIKFINALQNTTSMASRKELQSLFAQYAIEFYEEDPDQPETSTSSKVLSSAEHNFFDFEETKPIKITTPLVSIEYQIKRYLEDADNRLSSLGQHPTVKKMFIKFNTPLASSGPVERLFSFDEIAKRQRRQHLTHKQFEQIVILKANKNF